MSADPAAEPPEPEQPPDEDLPEPDEYAAEPDEHAPEPDEHAPEPDEHAPDPPPIDPVLVEQLEARIAELDTGLGAAQRRADELATVARHQSDMVDELHGENRRLRDGEIREAMAPLVRGIGRIWDDIARMRGGAGEDSADLAFLQERVTELLHDSGVLPLVPEPGTPFDPQIHQATGSATTGDPAKDRTIAELRRAGLRRDDGRMLRPADVVVHRFVALPEPPALAGDTAITEEVA